VLRSSKTTNLPAITIKLELDVETYNGNVWLIRPVLPKLK
jgi:hypothetical protein